MENLVGIPPIVVTKDEVTLSEVMSKLERLELDMPSMVKINEIDHRIQGNLNSLDSSINKVNKTLETLKSKEDDPSRFDKIEEVINALGTTLSSIKTKKVETPTKKGPKLFSVPKIPQPNAVTPIAKGNEILKTMEQVPPLEYN